MSVLGRLIGDNIKSATSIYKAINNGSKFCQLNPLTLCTKTVTFQKRLFSSVKVINLNNRLFQKKTEHISLLGKNYRRNVSILDLKSHIISNKQFPIVNYMDEKNKSSLKELCTCAQPIMDPRGKVAIVTGGMRGIGLCMAEELICLGAKVLIMDVDERVGHCEVERLTRTYGKDNACFFKGDVTHSESFQECFNQTLCKYNRVDILVNNAGILQPQNWQDTIKINFNGLINGIHLGVRYMGANYGKQGGIIINIASIIGHIPLGGAPIYTATKHGVLALTLGYAEYIHYNKTCVRMCAICPGVTDTAMIQVNKLNMDVDQKEFLDCQLRSLPSQPAERLGPAVSHVVRYGPNGSVWICENNELYQVCMPNYQDLECPGTRVPKLQC